MPAKKIRKTFSEIPIKTVSDFIAEINRFKKGRRKVWYRGHSEQDYKLAPSIYRKPFEPDSEDVLMSQFKSRAIPYLNNIPNGKNEYWEWLFLMQHYKIPTRLLDWTESALVALAFAVVYRDNKKRNENKQGAHVWCLDALKLNSKYNNLDKDVIPNITENEYAQDICDKIYTPPTGKFEAPIAVYGPQNNPRIVGQKGVFTIFPTKEKFQYDDFIGDIGIKLVIKTEAQVTTIANELFGLGISESMIFPELDSISSEIKREHVSALDLKKRTKKN
ncbi:MAG: hypothetical protein BroJett005_21890 [Ignavibacteriota bacterium]|nr:MAG: hypothetical protein BroJett005_21890 [Ignavibacteriota bacterium]